MARGIGGRPLPLLLEWMQPSSAHGEMPMNTVETITAAIAQLPPEQIEQVRAWLVERAEADWDAQIERDERAGKLDALAERALAEHRAGRTRPL